MKARSTGEQASRSQTGGNVRTIPARGYAAFKIAKGQLLTIRQPEGPQVADVNAYNLRNLREHLQAALSAQLNGSYSKFTTLYSNSPKIDKLLTVVSDPVGVHFLSGSVGCTYRHYQAWTGERHHPNCFDNLADAVKPWGLTHHDVHGPFNAFMNVSYDRLGRMNILPPKSKKGDYITLKAEMSLLVAISACPSDANYCNGRDKIPKSLEILVE